MPLRCQIQLWYWQYWTKKQKNKNSALLKNRKHNNLRKRDISRCLFCFRLLVNVLLFVFGSKMFSLCCCVLCLLPLFFKCCRVLIKKKSIIETLLGFLFSCDLLRFFLLLVCSQQWLLAWVKAPLVINPLRSLTPLCCSLQACSV